MEYEVTAIRQDIRITLDENKLSTSLIESSDVDTLTLNEIIDSKIIDASKSVLAVAPINLIGKGKPFGDSITWQQNRGIGMGFTVLPEDFFRLITFQMTDWSYAVNQVIEENSASYHQLHSRFSGISGNPESPKVAITMWPIGRVLEFYNCSGGESVGIKRARYLPRPTITEKETIDLPEDCYRSIIYYSSGLVSISTGNSEQAELLIKTAKDIINIE